MAVNDENLPQSEHPEDEIGEQLNERQKRFIDEYLIDLNGTQAAIRAGYSENGANTQAVRLLSNATISAELQRRRDAIAERMGLTQEWVLKNLEKVVTKSLQDEPVLDRQGNETGEYKFDSMGANRALELVGKHLGMFVNKTEVNAKVKSDVKADVNVTGDATFTIKIPNSKQLTDAGDSDADS